MSEGLGPADSDISRILSLCTTWDLVSVESPYRGKGMVPHEISCPSPTQVAEWVVGWQCENHGRRPELLCHADLGSRTSRTTGGRTPMARHSEGSFCGCQVRSLKDIGNCKVIKNALSGTYQGFS